MPACGRTATSPELNAFGDPGVAGLGLSYSSALTRALEGGLGGTGRPPLSALRSSSLAKFSAAVESRPTFPVYALRPSECAFEAGRRTWRQHAERAVEILRHTTELAGHHSHHDEVYRVLRGRLEEPCP